jgi:3-hydroxybutyryl-CoA dehydrogenase
MEIRINDTIAVFGAGTMGVGIAQVAATAGHPVIVIDSSEEALQRGRLAVCGMLDTAVGKGRLDRAVAGSIWDRLQWSTERATAAPAALVVEAIVEKLDTKRELFAALEPFVREDALLASNTSSLRISDIANPLSKRNRFIGLHFFNPVPAMKLVEVVGGGDTDPEAIEAATSLMRAWGKHAVRTSDVPGFIVNRVARPYYSEGFAALEEGIDPATIDAALTEAGGFRMGPLGLADLIGHDVNYAVGLSVHEAGVGAPRFRPQNAQLALIQNEALGRKCGRGVYDYAVPLPTPRYDQTSRRPINIRVSNPGLLQPLVEGAQTAGISVTQDHKVQSETINVDGTNLALGDGRTLAQRTGVDVLIDHARDFAVAKTLVLSASNSSHADVACGFLLVANRRPIIVADRPGQLVLRTLCQLANAAADTITDKIASEDDVDTAMRYGANHPEAPLIWARRIGYSRVHLALKHLTSATGDSLYEPSPLFAR